MPDASSSRALRVAILCPGVDVVQRGFERMMRDIFDMLEGELDVHLIKGGGERREHEFPLRFMRRNGRLVRVLPIHKLMGRTTIHSECLTFALAFLWHLRRHQYDVVHCVDPPLARLLYRLRDLLGLRFRLLYSEGTAQPPANYPPADHMQQISRATYDEALAHGHAADYMTLLPLGTHPARFTCARSREELRHEWGVPEDSFVVLCVSALNRGHKRTHYVVDELARVPGKVFLWLDGSMDQGDPDLVDYAHERLGSRVRVSCVASDRLPELLKMADLFVHGALFEAFGLALIEAASTDLPILVHNADHFRWLMGHDDNCIDMSIDGELAASVTRLMGDPLALRQLAIGPDVRQRFDWQGLRSAYLAMYREVGSLPDSALRRADALGIR